MIAEGNGGSAGSLQATSVQSTQEKSRGGLQNSSWPMYCHDPQHTGQSPFNTSTNEGGIKWSYRGWIIESSPTIGKDGIIYVGSGGPLYAIYPNGTLKWAFWTDLGFFSSPAIDENGTIYIGSDDGHFYAVNPNRTTKWIYTIGGLLRSSPAIDSDGTIFFGSVETGKLYALYPNGTVKWTFATGDSIFTSPAIGPDGTIYCTSNDRHLYAIFPNGTFKWSFVTNDIPGSPAIAKNGTIYEACWDGYLYAINPNSTKKWDSPIGEGCAFCPAIANDGTIYIGGDRLYAINSDGTRKWAFDAGPGLIASSDSVAISRDGTLYYAVSKGFQGGDITAINPDGNQKWRETIATNWVYSSPAIGNDGTVYIGSSSMGTSPYGQLYAFNGINNQPPTIPIINGPSSGKTKQNYNYTIVSNDPDGNSVSYYIDWGDGKNTGWIGPYTSGYELTVNHSWKKEGTYTIKAKAIDNYSAESGWGTLSVTMPLSYEPPHFRFFEWLFGRFPHVFPILRHLAKRY